MGNEFVMMTEDKQPYFQPLYENQYYEIFNRGNNNDYLFYNDQNYAWFLFKFCGYILPYVEVFAYNLFPSSFRMVIKIKQFDSLPPTLQSLRKGKRLLFDPSQILSEQFRRFFIAYSKGVTQQEKRTGSLFEKNFKRIFIPDPEMVPGFIRSVHLEGCGDGSIQIQQYKYSSYPVLLYEEQTFLNRTKIFDWFGGIENFIKSHQG